MASIAHSQALQHWSKSNQAGALAQINRAIKLETKEYLLAKHLLFKGEVEWALDRKEESFSTLKEAEKIANKYLTYWSKPSNSLSRNQLKNALQRHV